MKKGSTFWRAHLSLTRAMSVLISVSMVLSLMPSQGVAEVLREVYSGKDSEDVSAIETAAEESYAGDKTAQTEQEDTSSEEEESFSVEDATSTEEIVTEQEAKQDETTDDSGSDEVMEEAPDQRIAENDSSDEEADDQTIMVEDLASDSTDGDETNDDDQIDEEQTDVKTEYTYEDRRVRVTATVTRADAVPDNAELRVTSVRKNDADFDAYMNALNDTSINEKEYSADNTLLYDVSFVLDGQQIEPEEGSVRVVFDFKKNQLTKNLDAQEPGEVEVAHLPVADDGTVNVESLNANVSVENETAEFIAPSFSVFAFSYTVDFNYGGYAYSIVGGSSITISELFGILGIEEDVADVANVEFSNQELVRVEHEGNDWLLTSLKPFRSDELLTVTMTNGDNYLVEVTDDATEQTELSLFLSGLTVEGLALDGTTYSVVKGQRYEVEMSFTENSVYQFDNDGVLTYTLPNGVKVLDNGIENKGMIITIHTSDGDKEVPGAFSIDADGKVSVTFDTTSENYHYLESSTNVRFHIRYYAQFDSTLEFKNYEDGIIRHIDVSDPEPGTVIINKTGNFNKKTLKMEYTVTVTATGENVTDVNVWDEFTGNDGTLTLVDESVQVSGNSTTPTANNAGSRNFDYTFPRMNDGEVITITYKADVHFDKDVDKDGKLDVSQTGNRISANTKNKPEPTVQEFKNEITYRTTKKSDGTVVASYQNGHEVGINENGDKIIEWSIEYNKELIAPANGTEITDRIADASQEYMKYYGEGINVEVYNKDGALVKKYPVAYNALNKYNDYTWSYTIPNEDTEVYRYVITYNTIVDQKKVDQTGDSVTLDNAANGDGGQVAVGPSEEVEISKTHTSANAEEMTWVATLTVPKSGLTKAVVIDELPYIASIGICEDPYIVDSIDVEGLDDNEAYSVEPTTEKGLPIVKITFYKDKDKTVPGLNASENTRNIVITLKTAVNEEWLKYDFGYKDTSIHSNTIRFGSKVATDSVTLIKPVFKKEYVPTGTASDREFLYQVILSNVMSDENTIIDNFDTSLFDIVTEESVQIGGGINENNHILKKKNMTVTKTPTGAVFTTTNGVSRDDAGNFYPFYGFEYKLRLKDGVDLKQLASLNADGKYNVTNTAKWNGYEKDSTFTVTYDHLKKELLNDGAVGGANRDAQYKITYNPTMGTLYGGEERELTDTLNKNLAIDASSIKVEAWNAAGKLPDGSIVYDINFEKDAEGNRTGGTVVTYKIPDSTKVEITYTAKVMGNGTVEIQNTARIGNNEKDIKQTKNMGADGGGAGEIVSLKVLKVDGYNHNKRLSGVRFKFFAADGSSVGAGQEKTLYYTTDQDGMFTIESGQKDANGVEARLSFGTKYYLEEVEAKDGYNALPNPYEYTFTNDAGEVDHARYVYFFNDSAHIENWPLEGLVLEKAVVGGDSEDLNKEFTFKVTAWKEDANGKKTFVTGKNGDDVFDNNGQVTVTLKPGQKKSFWGFTKGTHYTVEEVLTNEERLEYPTTDVTYDFITFDDEGNETERTTQTNEGESSYTGELTSGSYETVKFTNHKTSPGSLKLKKLVTVNGAPAIGTLADGAYTFKVTGPAGADVLVTKTVVITIAGKVTSAEIDGKPASVTADGFIQMNDLKAGDYTIAETGSTNSKARLVKAEGGKSVTNNVVTATVATGNTTNAAAVATFTNNVVNPGSLKVKKSVNENGGEISDGVKARLPQTYTFALYTDEACTKPLKRAAADGNVSEPVTTSITINTNGGSKTSQEIAGLEPGDYWVKETVGASDIFVPATNPVKVTVVAGKTGEESVVAEFTNNYPTASAVLSAKKAANAKLGDRKFRFKLFDDEDELIETSAEVGQGETATFSAIGYTLADAGKEYTYKIREVLPDGVDAQNRTKDGVTYDTSVETCKVKVSKGDDGTLAVTYNGNEKFVTPEFTNDYETSGEGEVRVKKDLKGREWKTGDSFEFTLVAKDGAPAPAKTEVTVTKDSAGLTESFGKITFDRAGTYRYVVSEVHKGETVGGVAYDAKDRTVTIEVADDGKGSLVAAEGSKLVQTAAFTNTYTPGAPTFEKKIQDANDSTGETSGWQDSADYDIGDAVPYRLVATLPGDVTTYKSYHVTIADRMEDSLDLDAGSIDVRLIGADGNAITDGFSSAVNAGTHGFEATLRWAGADAGGAREAIADENLNGAKVVLLYNATLNSDAALGKRGNVNGARLRYSSNPADFDDGEGSEGETPWDYVIAFTYKVAVDKVDEDDKALEGAEFKLEKLVKGEDNRVVAKDLALSTGSTFVFKGLDDGDYVLTETKAPKGCRPVDDIRFTVTADHLATWDVGSDDEDASVSADDRSGVLALLTGDVTTGELELRADDALAGLAGSVENTRYGALEITKRVTVGGRPATSKDFEKVDGDYTFSVQNGDGSISKAATVSVKGGEAGTARVDDLPEGTYIVSETDSRGLIPDEVSREVKVEEGKSAKVATVAFTNNLPGTPTFEKKIMDTNDSTGETSGWQDSADYDIGDAVPFKLTAKLANDVSTYRTYRITFEDEMEKGLTFGQISKVTVGGEEVTDYELTKTSDQAFAVKLEWGSGTASIGDAALNNALVEVYFDAILNEDATVGSEGNVNGARLRYSNRPDSTDAEDATPWDYVIAFTYTVGINKLDQDGEALKGADFKLEKLVKGAANREVPLVVADNVFTARGIDDGHYVITEVDAPEGYEKVDPIPFEVVAGHVAARDDLAPAGDVRAQVLQSLTGELASGAVEFRSDPASGLVATDVKNQGLGSLKVIKHVTVGGSAIDESATDKTIADGVYTFEVTGPRDYKNSVEVEVKNGASAEARLDGLYPGEYAIEEAAPTNGTHLTTAKVVKAEVTANNTAGIPTAEFTNNLPGAPTFEKKIQDANDSTGETSGWQDSADYDIGDAVPYRLVATLPGDVTTYKKYHLTFTDKMEDTLDYNNDAVVTMRDKDGNVIDANTYTVEKTENTRDFQITLSWAGQDGEPISDTAFNGATAEVLFSATLNKNAKLGREGNVNAAMLAFSNNPDSEDDSEEGQRPWDYVIAFTYKLDINKLDKTTGDPLAGAEFKLEKLVKGKGKAKDKYVALNKAVEVANGRGKNKNVFSVKGLDDGKYRLTETKAPRGYDSIDPVVFSVAAGHVETWDYTSDASKPASFAGPNEGESVRTQILQSLTGSTIEGGVALVGSDGDETLSGLVGDVRDTHLGAIRITKVETFPDSLTIDDDYRKKIIFSVYNEDGELVAEHSLEDFTTENNEYGYPELLIEDLQLGTYMVIERRIDQGEWKKGDWTSVSIRESKRRTDTVEENKIAESKFRNVYDTVENLGYLKVKKVVDSDKYTGDEEFEFTLSKAEVDKDELGNDTRSDHFHDDVNEVKVTARAGEVASFGEIAYTESGTYYYTITETEPADEDKTPGMAYNTEPMWARVDVPTDNMLDPDVWYGESKEAVDAKAEAGAESEGDSGFATVTNTYELGKLRIVKTLRGASKEYADKEFMVTVTDEAGRYLDENGNLSDDEYEMAVSAATPLEIDDVPPSIYTVTEVATDREIEGNDINEDESTTQATVEVKAGDEAKTATLNLVNVYGMLEEEARLKVTKKVAGDEYHGKEAFMFRLSRFVDEAAEEDESYEQGDVLPDNDTVTIKAGETGAFGKITYTQPGDYFYTVNEVVPQRKTDGMTYDTNTYLVLVSVDDDLNASDPVYAKYVGDETFDTLYEALDSGDKTAAKLVVTNIYKKKTTNDDTTKQDDKTTNESNKTHTPSTTTTTTTTPTTATTAAHTSSSAPTVQTTTATRTTTAKTSDPTSFAMAAVLAVIGLLAVAAGRRRAKQLA